MNQGQKGERVAEIRLRPIRTNLAALPPAIATILLFLWLAAKLGSDPGSALWVFPAALALFLPIAAVHELLHGLAAVICGPLRWQDIRLGLHWRALAPMCHIKAPMRVSVTRIVGLAPLALTGPPALALLIAFPSELTALLASFVVIGCYADVYMFYRLRKFDAAMWVVDHPREGGFDVYAAKGPRCAS